MRLSNRVPELAALEVVLAVARTGSLNAAAHELGVSQQAVSARITGIEAQSGVVLVRRSPRGSSLTDAGVVVAQWADTVLAAARQLDTGLAALRGDRRTRLRLSASLTIAENLLPQWLVAFRAAGAARGGPVEVRLTAANSEVVVDHVRGGHADLGFIEAPSVPSGLRSTEVGRDRLVLVAAPGDRLTRRRRPVGPAALAAMPLVSRELGSGTREALVTALRAVLGAQAGPAEPLLALSTSSAIRAAVAAGAGPAVLSEFAVADDVAAGRLVLVPTSGIELTRVLRAIWTGPRTVPAGPARDLVAHITARR